MAENFCFGSTFKMIYIFLYKFDFFPSKSDKCDTGSRKGWIQLLLSSSFSQISEDHQVPHRQSPIGHQRSESLTKDLNSRFFHVDIMITFKAWEPNLQCSDTAANIFLIFNLVRQRRDSSWTYLINLLCRHICSLFHFCCSYNSILISANWKTTEMVGIYSI